MMGLDVTPDGRFIIASVRGFVSSANPSHSGLRRVSLDTKEVVPVKLSEEADVVFHGANGMVFGPGGELFIVYNPSSPALFVATFDDDYTVAKIRGVFDYDKDLQSPSTAAIVGDFIYVVDGQFGILSPPDLPFQLLKAPIYDVLGCDR